MERYLVNIGRRNPAVIEAASVEDAAFRATVQYPDVGTRFRVGVGSTNEILVQDENGKVASFDLETRKCRKCGCTEQRACAGGCCWMAWDLCSQCVFVR